MTTLTQVLAPDAPDDDPSLLLGPPAGSAARCLNCGRSLTVREAGWAHLEPEGWLCPVPAATLAAPDTPLRRPRQSTQKKRLP